MTAIAPPPVGIESEPRVQSDNARAVEALREPAANLSTRAKQITSKLTKKRVTSLGALAAFGAASLVAGAVSGMVNRKPRNKLWYRTLRKPAFTPPDRVFALVWPALYATAAISGWRVWNAPPSAERRVALTLWGTQLAFNASWSPIFFGAHRPKLALVDLAGNMAALGAYAYAAAKVDRPAAALVTPYLGWLGFAGAMNAGIVTNNKWRFR